MIKFIKKEEYNSMIKEIENQDKQIDKLRAEIAKLHEIKKENEYLSERNKKYLKTMREKNKKIKFLNERENKLQTIEMLYANQPVDLKKLNDLIMEVK